MSETDQLIFEFFKRFASFESSLKILGKVGINPNATLKWHELKDKLEESGFTFTEEQRKLEVITKPPKKRLFNEKDNKFEWDENIDSYDYGLAIDLLVRIRDNLFHGSKKFGDSSESERNVRLISGALIVLDEVVKSLDIKEVYQDIVDYWS